MAGVPLIVVFGAAVRPDGRPSASLIRRIGYGAASAAEHPEARILCSGAVGRHGPSEASLMAERLVGAGVSADRLILDEESRDTLQSVVAASVWRARLDAALVLACSDAYHLPRILLMLRILGCPARRGPAPRGPAGSRADWVRMSLREGVALPYDAAIMILRRRELAAVAASTS